MQSLQKYKRQENRTFLSLIDAELELRRRLGGDKDANAVGVVDFTKYQREPARFGVELFGEHYTDDIIRVMQSVVDNPVTIAKSANAIGKTHGAARVAAWFYKCFPDAQVYTASAPPLGNLEKILWGEIYSIVNHHRTLFENDRILGNLNIKRDAQSFITGVPIPTTGTDEQREAKFSGKHAPHLLFIIDEADAVPPEVFRGIESCMSGGFARLLIMFNPRSEVGTVANMIRAHEGNVITMNAFTHPNVIEGRDVILGAVTREKTVRRINQWTRPLAPNEKPDNECFELPEFLVGATAIGLNGEPYAPLPAGWRKVETSSFHYMVLGQYPPQSEMQLISQTWIDAAVTRWLTFVAQYGEIPPRNVTPLIGLDLADQGNDKNALCKRFGGYVDKIEAWKGVDVDAATSDAAEKLGRLEITPGVPMKPYSMKVFCDATGVGAGSAPRLRKRGFSKAESVMVANAPTYIAKDENGDVIGEFFQLRDQLWWSCREWLRTDPGAMLPPDDDLTQELHTPLYAIKNGKIRISSKDDMKDKLGRSPDKAESLVLTFAPTAQVAGAVR